MEGSAVQPGTGFSLFAQGQSEPPQAFEQDQHSCSAIVSTAFEDIGIVVNVANDFNILRFINIKDKTVNTFAVD